MKKLKRIKGFNEVTENLNSELSKDTSSSMSDISWPQMTDSEVAHEDSESLMLEVVDKIRPFYQKHGLKNTIDFLESILHGINDIGDEYFGE